MNPEDETPLIEQPWNSKVLMSMKCNVFEPYGDGSLSETLYRGLEELVGEHTSAPSLSEQTRIAETYEEILSGIYGDNSSEKLRIEQGLATVLETATYLEEIATHVSKSTTNLQGTSDSPDEIQPGSSTHKNNGRKPFGGPIELEDGHYRVGVGEHSQTFNLKGVTGALIGVLYRYGDITSRDWTYILNNQNGSEHTLRTAMKRIRSALSTDPEWTLTTVRDKKTAVGYSLDRKTIESQSVL